MDYFFMNECTFKILLTEKKEFILKFLNSLNIFIKDYDLFDVDIISQKTKVDILLFSNNILINLQFNKNKKSLLRNSIYIDCLQKILPKYKTIQININLFKHKNNQSNIYNYYNENEYIKFITAKDVLNFKTDNKYIKDVINYTKKIEYAKFKDIIEKEQKIKSQIDNLIKD